MSTSLYRDGFMHMPAGYALFNVIDNEGGLSSDYRLVEANGAFEQAVGTNVAQLEGKALSQFVRDAGFPVELFDALRRAATKPVEKEIFISKTGRWVKVSAYAPQPGHIMALLFELPRQKAAGPDENTLPEALRTAPLPVFITSPAGVILDANPESASASGYSSDELAGMNVYRLVERTSRVIGLMFFKELLQNGSATVQLQIKTKSGSAIWVNVRALKYGANYIFYCLDISSYKALENELVNSELLYRTFINASSDLIYLKDDRLRYMIVNDALLRAQGVDYTDIIGKAHEEMSPETYVDVMRETDLYVIETKESAVCEFSICGNYYEALKFPVPIGEGRTGVGAYIRSVTQKKRHEEMQRRTLERHRILANALLMTFQSSRGLVEYALQEALKLTGSQRGMLFTLEESTGDMVLRVDMSNFQHAACRPRTLYPISQAVLWGETARSARPVIENSYIPSGDAPDKAFARVHNFMSIPILKNDQVRAVVCLVNKNGDFDEYDVTDLSMLMHSVFMAAEKQDMQKNIENLYAQMQAMFNEHDAVMLLFDPATREIREANPAAVAFYGYSKEELLSLKYDDLLAPRDPGVITLPAGENKRFFSSPHRLKNGEIRYVDVYSCPINYHAERMIFSIIFDVTEREKAFEEVKYLSFHDHLTGLYNRRYFDNIIKQMDDERYYPLTIVVADVNGLKLVNDSFGHAQGDELLVKAAELLQQGCRKDDICARIGGDEFAILLPNTTGAQAGKIIRRIKRMQSKVKIKQLDLSLSFGHAVKQDAKRDIELVFSEAENRMYRNKMNESPSTRSKTIDIILKTLYGKSEEELRHAARVAKISARIASELSLPMDEVMLISEAGLLHDIGKIGIDKSILKKNGPFTRAERLEIERHSESGWRILSNSDEYARLADVILYHHESPDGKGYPRGIKGDSIPLASRIIAVAEAFDAMTSRMSYRKAISWEQAAEELRRKTGTQFDEKVVSVFLEKVLPNMTEEDLDLSDALMLLDRLKGPA